MDIFAERLKLLRISMKLTQAQLGKALDINTQMIFHYENGTRSPKLQTVIDISNFFNVSTDYLLGQSEYRTLIHEAGNWLGLSPEAAASIRKWNCATANLVLTNKNYGRLINAIHDYLLLASSNIDPNVVLLDTSEQLSVQVKTALDKVMRHGIEEAALAKVKAIIEEIAVQTKFVINSQALNLEDLKTEDNKEDNK